MRAVRAALFAVGLVIAGTGLWKLYQSGFANIFAAAKWLIGGVIAHDGILAPATIVLVVIATRVLPRWLRGPATVGLIVLGTATVLAIPVLGRFGARPDNQTLLDRNYMLGWLVLAVLVAVGVALGGLWQRRLLTREEPR